jgi:hypothetical protein
MQNAAIKTSANDTLSKMNIAGIHAGLVLRPSVQLSTANLMRLFLCIVAVTAGRQAILEILHDTKPDLR